MNYKAAIPAIFLIGVLCFNASAGCGRWVVRDTTDYFRSPLVNVKDPSTDAPNLTAKQDNFAKDDGTNLNDTIRANAKPKLDISGKWYVKLNGTANTYSRSYPAQSTDLSEDGKDRIHGYGNLKADSLTIPITGTGLLSNDTLDMGIKLGSGSAARKSIEKYVLRLFMGKIPSQGAMSCTIQIC